jgi:hypothetical protein
MVNTFAEEHVYYRKLERLNDRCDRCNAAATHRAVKFDGSNLLELLLCGHHFRANSYGLGLDGWLIQSETEE